ncbi:MAG: hypothetical protein WC058_15435 [Phycisphaeraceae bacterium]
MAKLNVGQIRELAKRIVLSSPAGIRYSELVRRIEGENPETPKNTIHGSVWDLGTRFPDKIHKPSRGLFLSVTKEDSEVAVIPSELVKGVREEDFYEPFAAWLKNELDEVTVAVSMGGAGLQKNGGHRMLWVFTSHLHHTESSLIWKLFPSKSKSIPVNPLLHLVKLPHIDCFRQSRTSQCRAAFLRKITDAWNPCVSFSESVWYSLRVICTNPTFRFAFGHSDFHRTCFMSMSLQIACTSLMRVSSMRYSDDDCCRVSSFVIAAPASRSDISPPSVEIAC